MAKLLSQEHPEIFHYTTTAGLKGIIESQTLWATHYAYLNDAEEIRHFGHESLKAIIKPVVAKALMGLRATAPEKYKEIENKFGIEQIKQEDTNILIDLMYSIALGDTNHRSLVEPYITAFCAARDRRESENGLLSQWRGYGRDGGYAICFETAKIAALLQEESEKWKYEFLMTGKVLYSDASRKKIKEELHKQIHDIQTALKKLYEQIFSGGHDPTVLGPVLPALLRCSCLFKHWGFREEKEVRIVAIPMADAMRQEAEQKGRQLLPSKPKKHFIRRGHSVPYLNLFEDIPRPSGSRLPIKRIIIGPHAEKYKRAEAVDSLLKEQGIVAKILVSEIPYLGFDL